MDANEYFLAKKEARDDYEDKQLELAGKYARQQIERLLPHEIIDALKEVNFDRYGIDICNAYQNKNHAEIGRVISEIVAEYWRPIFINKYLESGE